jgi:hypothetical protein
VRFLQKKLNERVKTEKSKLVIKSERGRWLACEGASETESAGGRSH